ncbi:MAG TPA: hypothetical protein VEK15_26720 [Vicinamibacteria bacterium]|nr:hypothetical protein [Vicinamibacteria bacterium]
MSAVGSFFEGFGRVLSSPALVLVLFAVNLAAAIPAALVMSHSIEESIGASLVYQKLRDGFDSGWYGEFDASTNGLEDTFGPTLVGAGAFFDNIESWLNGSLFESYPAILGLGILYAVLWTFFLGGILQRYADRASIFRLSEFLSHGATFFFRFLRLALISAALYYGIYRLAGWLFSRIETATRDVTREEIVLGYVVAATVVVLVLLTLVNMAFDYAKIATLKENRNSMLLAALRGFGFVLGHFAKTVPLYYGLGLVGLALLGAYHLTAPGAGQATPASVVMAFLVGQAYLVIKLVLRLTFYASQLALFESES